MPIRKTHLSSLGLAAMLACALPALAQSLDFEEARDAVIQARDALVQAEAQPHVDNRYRIGIDCSPASDALRFHLRLQEDAGLLVNSVLDDSPGGRAGIKRHDVIVEANGHPISNVHDLVVAVNDAKTSEMTLAVIHAGEERLVKVTPEERDEEEIERLRNGVANQLQLGRGAFAPLNGQIQEELQRAIDQMQQQLGPLSGTFRRVNPGIMMDLRDLGAGGSAKSSTSQSMTMKNGEQLTIKVDRDGDKPAQITVKRGNNSWELTESEIDQLPADIQPLVESQLNGRKGLQAWMAPAFGGGPRRPVNRQPKKIKRSPNPADQRVQDRFDGLEIKMQELQDAIRSIQGNK